MLLEYFWCRCCFSARPINWPQLWKKGVVARARVRTISVKIALVIVVSLKITWILFVLGSFWWILVPSRFSRIHDIRGQISEAEHLRRALGTQPHDQIFEQIFPFPLRACRQFLFYIPDELLLEFFQGAVQFSEQFVLNYLGEPWAVVIKAILVPCLKIANPFLLNHFDFFIR